METAIIIRYGEIHLKGKNRGYFEKMLINNIKASLKSFNYTFVVMHCRYLIENYDPCDEESIMEKLLKIPGIHTFSKAFVTKNDEKEITDCVLSLCEDRQGTFKVHTNRADKRFPVTSMDFSAKLGGKILEKYNKTLKVDIKEPDFTIDVDIREDGRTFVYTDVIHGLGGMPNGSAGHGMLLISGGIDSPVAGYMMMKRGMKLNFIHYHSYPYTGEAAKQKVIDLTKIISDYNGGANLYVVSFTHIQEEIHKKCPEDLMITMMRRFMMRIAERLAIKLGDQAIITGESLGQVASQTIESMTSSNSVVSMPVLRPLIAYDKLDIIEVARKIDTYDTSILPYEDCCTVFLPKFPAIKPKPDRILKAEARLDVESLINTAMENIEKITL